MVYTTSADKEAVLYACILYHVNAWARRLEVQMNLTSF